MRSDVVGHVDPIEARRVHASPRPAAEEPRGEQEEVAIREHSEVEGTRREQPVQPELPGHPTARPGDEGVVGADQRLEADLDASVAGPHRGPLCPGLGQGGRGHVRSSLGRQWFRRQWFGR
ncbi:MAG: hypothetical protein QOH28_1170 [Actinomycetota bacterium]|nr:hypothetical protein [Actinomycetota bacterium]